MIRTLALLTTLVLAASAHASWYPRFETNWVTMVVGQKHTVTVQAQWSGLTDYGFSGWTFGSDRPDVATVKGGLNELGGVGTVEITAVAPGTATILFANSQGETTGGPRFVEISVGENIPARIDVSAPVTTIGKAVTLTVNYPAEYCWCEWYEGRIGDTSRPLAGGRELIVTPAQAGMHYYWVSVFTSFVTSSAEASVEVRAGRQRAVRH